MKLHKATGSLGLAALAVLGAPMAQAQTQTQDSSGWYAGANVGRSAATIDDERIRSGLLGQSLTMTSIDERDRATGYKLFGGWQFNRHFAVEAGAFDLGRFGYTAQTAPLGALEGSIRVRGLNLDIVGTLPVADRLSVLGRVGVTRVRSSDSFSASGAARMPYASANPSEHATGFKAGLGLAYEITEALSVRAEMERYSLRDAVGNRGHADLYSVGLVYRFGASPQPVRVATFAPVPVTMLAAAPPPAAQAPVASPAAPVAAPRAPMRVRLEADSLFDFDQSILKPAGRQALDKLIADLRGVSYDAIQVTGHTDRLGPQSYNLKLSARRAEAVSGYLSQAGGIAAGRISARGVSGDDPVTKPGDCKGSKPTPALVSCLQPDRRVEVEVAGTR